MSVCPYCDDPMPTGCCEKAECIRRVRKQLEEPVYRENGDPELTLNHTTGGGTRVIRSSRPFS